MSLSADSPERQGDIRDLEFGVVEGRLGHRQPHTDNPFQYFRHSTRLRQDFQAPDNCSYRELGRYELCDRSAPGQPLRGLRRYLRFWSRASCAAPLRLARSRSP